MAHQWRVEVAFHEAAGLRNARTLGFGDMNLNLCVVLRKLGKAVCSLETTFQTGNSYCNWEGEKVAFTCLDSVFGPDFTMDVIINHKSSWTDDLAVVGNFRIVVPRVTVPPTLYPVYVSGERTDGRLKMSVTVEELATVMPVPETTQNLRRSSGSSSGIGTAIVTNVVTDLIAEVIKSFFNDN